MRVLDLKHGYTVMQRDCKAYLSKAHYSQLMWKSESRSSCSALVQPYRDAATSPDAGLLIIGSTMRRTRSENADM